MEEQLIQCEKIAKSTGKRCVRNCSIVGEIYCPGHGGKKKDGSNPKSRIRNEDKILCGENTLQGLPCRNTVKKVGDMCAKHDPDSKAKALEKKLLKKTNVSKTSDIWREMDLAFIKCFTELSDNTIIRDLAKWYLILATQAKEKEAKKEDLTDEDWAKWISEGCSNASATSFKEKNKADPLGVLAGLAPMAPYKDFLLGKYKYLANLVEDKSFTTEDGREGVRKMNKFGAVNVHWLSLSNDLNHNSNN